jgi:hypothetical protein
VVGTWLDGVTSLLRKVVTIPAGPNKASLNVAHGITGIVSVVDVRCILTDGSSFLPVPFVDSAAVGSQCSAKLDLTNLVLASGDDLSGFSGHAILYYTVGAG